MRNLSEIYIGNEFIQIIPTSFVNVYDGINTSYLRELNSMTHGNTTEQEQLVLKAVTIGIL